MEQRKLTRRRFVRNAAAVFPVGLIALEQTAVAQDLPHLDPEDPVAKALLYVEDAADVDTSNALAARYETGQTCANCVQLQGEEGAEWRPCLLFPGKTVSPDGWCSAWVERPGA
jgi:hypothetical protein